MSPPRLRALDADAGTASSWTTALRAALAGGDALLPVPAGPAALRADLLASCRPDDPKAPLEVDGAVLVVPTSGSTGEPKGVVLSGRAVRASATATATRLSGPGRWVLALPLTHVAGLMVVARAVLAGTDPVELSPGVDGGFDPGSFTAATAQAAALSRTDGRPLYVSLVPTQLARLLDAGADLRPYAAVLLGAAAAPLALLARAASAGVPVVTTYGMTETCGGCVYDGVPLEGVTVDLAADGRVLLGGATLFDGYRLRPDLSAAAVDGHGRLVTSDLGEVGGGRLQVLGRADDVIVTGGVKVAPARVEDVLATQPGVGACAVAGAPDDEWGQRVVALVVPAAGGAAPTLAALRSAAAPALAPAWLPRGLVLVDELPMLATGKVDRAAVRALVAHGAVA